MSNISKGLRKLYRAEGFILLSEALALISYYFLRNSEIAMGIFALISLIGMLVGAILALGALNGLKGEHPGFKKAFECTIGVIGGALLLVLVENIWPDVFRNATADNIVFRVCMLLADLYVMDTCVRLCESNGYVREAKNNRFCYYVFLALYLVTFAGEVATIFDLSAQALDVFQHVTTATALAAQIAYINVLSTSFKKL